MPGRGKGIVAAEPIKAGQLIWTGEDARVQELLSEESVVERLKTFDNLDDLRFFLNHIYCYGGNVCALHDDSKFTNHSKAPVMATAATLQERGIAVIPFGRDPVDTLDTFAARDVGTSCEKKRL